MIELSQEDCEQLRAQTIDSEQRLKDVLTIFRTLIERTDAEGLYDAEASIYDALDALADFRSDLEAG